MPLNLAGYTTPKQICVPQDYTATIYGAIVDGSGYRSLSIIQAADAITGASHTKTGAVKYGSFTNLSAYDYTTTGDTFIPLRNGASDNVKIAHKFTTASASTPTFYSVKMRLREEGTVAAAKYVWVTIEGDSSGPDGTAVWTSYKKLAADISTASGGEDITFYFRQSATSALTASTVYYAVLQGDYTASSTNQIQARIDTVASGGTVYLYDSSWANVTTQTLETTCSVVTSWTAVSAYAFTAATATIEDVEATAIQEKVVDLKQYGPAIRYECVGAGTETTALLSVIGILGDPKSPA